MNRLLERQLVGWLARHPDQLASMPEIGQYLEDGTALSLLKVVDRTGSNPVAISDALMAQGVELSPDRVKTEVLQWSEPEFFSDPRAAYGMLKESHRDAQVIKDGKGLLVDLEAGRISRQEYFKKVMTKYSAVGDLMSRKKVSTREWATKGRQVAAFYKEMADKGLLLQMPRMWPELRRTVGPIILGTLMCIIGPSGGGKTIAAEQIAYEWAFECGGNVLFANTELTNDQEMWRYILKYYPVKKKAPSIQDFQTGYWDDDCETLMGRFAGAKGSITFMESSGVAAEDLVSEAAARDAHLVVDYADMLAKPVRGKTEMTETLAVAEQMTVLKNYAQGYNRCVVVIQQVTKQASGDMKRWMDAANELEGEAAMGSARFQQRANLMISLNFGKAKEDVAVKHPVSHDVITIKQGDMSPQGFAKVVKSTFGQSGRKINMFLDGANFRLLEWMNI